MQTPGISRITRAGLGDFATTYQGRQQPVVITDLFDGQPIRALDSLAAIRTLLGDEPVRMRPNYIETSRRSLLDFLRGRPVNIAGESREGTMNDFLELAAREPAKNWIVTESPTSPAILKDLDLSIIGVNDTVSGYGNPGQVPPTTANAMTFLANAGNASDLHTDWDGRDVLLYQAVGRKRVTLFPPGAAPRLLPIEIFSTVQLNGMPEAQRAAFVQSLGGYDFVLELGETVFMPAFFWHHLEYIDQGMSFNFRFGGSSDAQVMHLLTHYHRDMYTQNLWAAFVREPDVPEHRAVMARLSAAYDADYANPRAKYRALSARAADEYRTLFGARDEAAPHTWIHCGELFDGLLHFTYLRPNPSWSKFKQWSWIQSERCRALIRRLAYRVAYWM